MSDGIEPLAVTFTNGAGTTYFLDAEMPGGATRTMSRRDKALATALLELALENVRNSEVAP